MEIARPVKNQTGVRLLTIGVGEGVKEKSSYAGAATTYNLLRFICYG
jgi:hypothetical protein